MPCVHLTPFPDVYRDFGGDEDAASRRAMADLRTLTSTEIAAVGGRAILIEPVQGEGGFNPAPAGFLQELRALCDEHGILLIADEVQCGYGRTGKMWGFEHAGIVPDVVVPRQGDRQRPAALGDRRRRRELQERWGRGAHGSTYGGNPVACAAGGRGARDDPSTRGSSPTPPSRGARAAGRPRARSRPRTTGSATSAGPG